MTRDEAIEAGARAIFPAAFEGDPERGSHRARASRAAQRAAALHMAAAVLDAIGRAEPVAYVIAYDDRTPPSMVFQGVTDLPAALEWADPGERVWGLVPVEGSSGLGGDEVGE